jgi:hypothetical protein
MKLFIILSYFLSKITIFIKKQATFFIERLKVGYESLAPMYHFFTCALNEQWFKDEGFDR